MQTSGAMRRENADSHQHSTVMPAKAGIQYPAASRLKLGRLWNTGSSAFADDDSGELFDN
jgi:hypothetical protein